MTYRSGFLILAASICLAVKSPLALGVGFETDVVPILTRLGCNSGGCHGKSTGQNGFKLSLLGFEPLLDYEALKSEARGRRLFPASAEKSLLLLKATAGVPHGGGKRLDQSSEDYRMLFDWISAGAPGPQANDPKLERITVTPAEGVLVPRTEPSKPVTNPNAIQESARAATVELAPQQLKVTAYFSDGSTRDVTRQSVFQSNEPDVAEVDFDGLVKAATQPGLFVVMARYAEQIATFHGAVPFVHDAAQTISVRARLDQIEAQVPATPVNRELFRQWRRLSVVPSTPASDVAFLRRASLDICGTLPTPEEVRSFLADGRADKRARLIDRLLERPEYASYFALKWGDILQNRGAGYSTSKQRAGTTLFAGWIRDSIETNKPYDQFVAEIITASGSQNENPPAIWYRSVRKLPEFVESVAQAFLGVRIQCAQCHHHPTEHWSQADYFGLAACFARVGRKGGFADAEVPTDEIIYLKATGEVRHPRTGDRLPPKPLDGSPLDVNANEDPRLGLARWMIRPENRYFARTMANRLWAHFMGRGIVHPIDDARSTNPPSNPALLTALADEFTTHGYDVKHLIRAITSSYSYSLATEPNDTNARDLQTFARFYPRRLPAEVLLDGISHVLDVPTEFAGTQGKLPLGTRAIELPDENVPSRFLDMFGRPARRTACECERVDAAALTQALELVNSTEIQRKLTAESGFAQRIATSDRSPAQRATDIFVRVLGREPLPNELQVAVEYFESEPDTKEACRSLLWSLLATNEFLFNH